MTSTSTENGQPAGEPGQRLRILSYNVQVGISTSRFRDYFTHGWKHVLPFSGRQRNLHQVARLMRGFDIVGLQEVDAGSLRSGHVNQTEYLARVAGFPFWRHRTNRDLGYIARHSLGLASRREPREIIRTRLPGAVPGRGMLMARFGEGDDSLLVAVVHLALGRGSRQRQMEAIAEYTRQHRHAIVMGDFNCLPDSPEMQHLQTSAGLVLPEEELYTYPSWRPSRHIDHILVTPGIQVEKASALNVPYSDHLPLALEVTLPASVSLFS